ncbi:MAG: insulinase family protein [Nitrospinae bacterium]|nr:insulinase family protein [Nitrospinota bacterium]MDA1108197.1 insulinase family protein [Nitrospinota bacterium]
MLRINHSRIVQCFLVLLLLFTWTTVEAAKRETKTLTLKNGLDVLLVYDPEVHRSAASLSVGVGSLYDPPEKMGLAHYLEHMLFLGTEKFPEAGSYKKYLGENSGSSNAYTGGDITNYFFEVSHGAFEGALDRFSDFFKAPLFDKKYAEREVNAVNSEHDKNKRSDSWRANYVTTQIAEKGHPIRSFGTGNKDTLAGDNQPALLDFYNKYYSASIMKVAMLSSLPLATQESLVQKYFEGIPSHPVKLPYIDPNFRKPLKDKYRLLKIKMIKDVRSMEIEFPTIHLNDHLDSKPASIVASVIGHEGKGSLLSKLKEEGLVLGLSAGGGSGHPNINSMSINVSLTKKGVEEYERILEMIFSYIQKIKSHGIEEYTFKESQTMAQINFDWKDPDEGMGYVAGQTALMQTYKLEDLETLPFLFKKYDPAVYQEILNTMTPGNALVVLKTNAVETDKTDQFYGAEYSISEIGGEKIEKLRSPMQVAELIYPEVNDFIPYNLKLSEEDPHLVRDDDLAKIWFQFDSKFKQPKVYMSLRIETPRVYDTVAHSQLAGLYSAAVSEGLNEIVYPIQMAGLSYSLGTEKKGVNLTIGGYSERVGELLRLVTRNLKSIKIDQQKFDNIKEAMVRGLQNNQYGQAYSRGGYYHGLMLLDRQYTEEEALAALKPLTLDDVRTYAKTLYEKVYITGMAYGNWTDEKVKESVQVVLDEIQSQPLPKEERFEQVVEVLDPSENIVFSRKVEDNNNSLAYGLQIGEKSLDRSATAQLLASIIESDFYTQMRTQQQLGYIVWSFNQTIENRMFMRFVIQSANHSPFELKRKVDAWLQGTGELLDNLTDEEFERHRASQIVSLEKEGESIGEVMGDLFYLATEEKGDFDYKKKLIHAVKNLKKEDVIAAGKKWLTDQATSRLVILMRSNNNEEPLPEGVLSEVKQFKDRRGIEAQRMVPAKTGS